MIKAVLLDSDDTILDFGKAEHEALKKTLLELGIRPTEETIALYSGINKRHWEMLERGELSRAEVLIKRFEAFFAALGLERSASEAQGYYGEFLSQGHYFIPGAVELLEALYGKYKLYLVTNGNTKVQRGRFESANIGHYFDEIFISELIGHNKPAKEFFDYCFARMPAFEKDEMIIIGDSLTSDILGGIKAGIHTCRFNPHSKPGREDIVPEYEVRSLGGIPELLKSL